MSQPKASTLTQALGINKLIVGLFVAVALALTGASSVSAANGYGNGGNHINTNTNIDLVVAGIGNQVSIVVNNVYNFFF